MERLDKEGADMKTLDEVIEAQKRCETYPNCHFCYLHSGPICEWIRDVLIYLKEYKIKRERIMAQAQACDDTEKRLQEEIARYQDVVKEYEEILTDYVALKQYWAEQQANEPLAWKEMKRMTGKPVWVEEYWAPMEDEAGVTEDEGDTEAYWAILTYADEKRISVVNGRVDQWLHKDIWNNHEVSHSWQAYRKERS